MIDGNDIWESLFSILKGNVPEELTEDVLGELASWISRRCEIEVGIARTVAFAARNTRPAPITPPEGCPQTAISEKVATVEGQEGVGEAAFIKEIHDRTPNGEWICVQHHPNGDWSVAEEPE